MWEKKQRHDYYEKRYSGFKDYHSDYYNDDYWDEFEPEPQPQRRLSDNDNEMTFIDKRHLIALR